MSIRCKAGFILGVGLCFGLSVAAPAATAPSGFPFADEELTYSIVWPSGLSLGEAHLKAVRAGPDWTLDLKVDAAVPGFAIADHYSSNTSGALCTSTFQRDTIHGSKRANEKITISSDGRATRETVLGGKSEFPVSPCAHDALNFLYFTRRELGQGRIPPAQTVLFGPGYPVTLEYAGQQSVLVGGVPNDSDKVNCTIHQPKGTDYKIEMYFARDAARTPLVMRAPFALGTFSVELQR